MKFKYKARDAHGNVVKGGVEAASAVAAGAMIRRQTLLAIMF